MGFFVAGETVGGIFGGDEKQQKLKRIQMVAAQLSYWKDYNMRLKRKILLKLIDANSVKGESTRSDAAAAIMTITT